MTTPEGSTRRLPRDVPGTGKEIIRNLTYHDQDLVSEAVNAIADGVQLAHWLSIAPPYYRKRDKRFIAAVRRSPLAALEAQRDVEIAQRIEEILQPYNARRGKAEALAQVGLQDFAGIDIVSPLAVSIDRTTGDVITVYTEEEGIIIHTKDQAQKRLITQAVTGINNIFTNTGISARLTSDNLLFEERGIEKWLHIISTGSFQEKETLSEIRERGLAILRWQILGEPLTIKPGSRRKPPRQRERETRISAIKTQLENGEVVTVEDIVRIYHVSERSAFRYLAAATGESRTNRSQKDMDPLRRYISTTINNHPEVLRTDLAQILGLTVTQVNKIEEILRNREPEAEDKITAPKAKKGFRPSPERRTIFAIFLQGFTYEEALAYSRRAMPTITPESFDQTTSLLRNQFGEDFFPHPENTDQNKN